MERFRKDEPRRLAVGLALSLCLHLAAAALLTTREGAAPREGSAGRLTLVVLPPLEEPPPAPGPPAVRLPPPREVRRPATPVAAPERVPEEPAWVPHDVPPRLVNGAEVRRLLEEAPAGAGGGASVRLVVLWLYVERDGQVSRLRIARSSGSRALDDAAREAATAMRFRPALYRGRPVGVWISQPIRFSVEFARGS